MEQRSGDVADSLGRLSKCSCEPCESSWELEGCTPVSLLVEMGVLPLEWVAKLKCVEFWYRVRKLGDKRLVKHVAVEAWKQREMKWMKDLRQSI